MKKLLVIIGTLVLLIGVSVGFVFYATGDLVRTADGFFAAVKAADMPRARSFLAEDFKANTDEAALNEFLSRTAITGFKKASWSGRSMTAGRGELDGSITTEAGGAIPIKLTLVKENGSWKIFSLHKPTAGLQPEQTVLSVPTNAEQLALVKKSMHEFAISINAKNMEQFRSGVSQVFKRQYSTEKLNEVYASVMEVADLTVLDPLDPTFDGEPSVNESGVLSLNGHYATSPNQVLFEQQYVYEGTTWRILAFGVKFR